MFSSRLPLADLVQWCRALHHGIDIGLSPVKLFKQQAKSGPRSGQSLAADLAKRLSKGSSMTEAMAPHAPKFPKLFLELIAVGEQSGRLTEIFRELEEQYRAELSSRKKFLQAMIWPAMTYCAAIAIVSLMVLILGLIGGGFDPLGIGLLGFPGAILVSGLGATFAAFVVGMYLYVRDHDEFKSRFEAFAMRIPALRGCFRAFALQRFSLALYMTNEAGMSVEPMLASSFRATSNQSYTQHIPEALRQAKAGRPIHKTIASFGTTLFPEEFLDAVSIGETSGRLVEVMGKQADQYREEAHRQMLMLSRIASGVVYGMVMLMVIFIIFRIALSIGGVYEDAMKGI